MKHGTASERRPNTVGKRPALEWLWPDWFAAGRLHLLVAGSQVDRVLVLANLIARLTRGSEWPDGARAAQPAEALWFSYTASVDKTVRPAILASGADTDRVRVFPSLLSLSRPSDQLDGFLRSMPGTRLVVIDSLNGFLVNVGCPSSKDVPAAVERLASLAQHRRVAIVGVLGFGAAGTAAIFQGWASSVTYADSAALVHGLGANQKRPRELQLFQLKNALQTSMPKALPYRIVEGVPAGRVEWGAQPVIASTEGSHS
jgi:AAA domain